MSGRRFCFSFFACSATAFLTCAAVNFFVNPYAQYAPRLVEPMVFTSRSVKVVNLDRYNPPPAGLILGSSRVLKVEPDYLANNLGIDSVFNAGVYFGKQEDNLAFLRFYRDRFGSYPETVIVGVDVYGFNDALMTDARLLSNDRLLPHITKFVPWRDQFQGYKDLVSWKQTKSSIQSIVRLAKKQDRPEPVESFDRDGHIVYHEREKQIESGTYDFESAIDFSKREYKGLFAGFNEVSERRFDLLMRLVDECNRGETDVILFVTPLHPQLFDYVAETTTYLDRREDLIQRLREQAVSRGFSFYDFSELSNFDGDPAHFVDGIHPLESNTRRMIDVMIQQRLPETSDAVQ